MQGRFALEKYGHLLHGPSVPCRAEADCRGWVWRDFILWAHPTCWRAFQSLVSSLTCHKHHSVLAAKTTSPTHSPSFPTIIRLKDRLDFSQWRKSLFANLPSNKQHKNLCELPFFQRAFYGAFISVSLVEVEGRAHAPLGMVPTDALHHQPVITPDFMVSCVSGLFFILLPDYPSK